MGLDKCASIVAVVCGSRWRISKSAVGPSNTLLGDMVPLKTIARADEINIAKKSIWGLLYSCV